MRVCLQLAHSEYKCSAVDGSSPTPLPPQKMPSWRQPTQRLRPRQRLGKPAHARLPCRLALILLPFATSQTPAPLQRALAGSAPSSPFPGTQHPATAADAAANGFSGFSAGAASCENAKRVACPGLDCTGPPQKRRPRRKLRQAPHPDGVSPLCSGCGVSVARPLSGCVSSL